jgi:hypothetical protein
MKETLCRITTNSQNPRSLPYDRLVQSIYWPPWVTPKASIRRTLRWMGPLQPCGLELLSSCANKVIGCAVSHIRYTGQGVVETRYSIWQPKAGLPTKVAPRSETSQIRLQATKDEHDYDDFVDCRCIRIMTRTV